MTIDPSGVRLLLVDADCARGTALAATLSAAGYRTIEHAATAPAPGGDDTPPDLVLLDLDDDRVGAETVAGVRAQLGAPIIGLTADATPSGRRRAAGLDLNDVALRPVDELELRARIDRALATGRMRRLLNDRSARLTEALRERTAELDTVRESLSVLAAMADYHDDDTDRHAHRVGIAAGAIAAALGLPGPEAAMLRAAAPLHDIGKVGISRRILLKPGKLTPSEWLHMQSHVEIGAQILASARSPVLVLAAEIARTHHERFDGTGYASGLSGDEIPLSGRIVAVADVWDTLTHDRPYRRAWTAERALAQIHDDAGTHFDPRVVEAFASLTPDASRLSDDGRRAA